MCRGRPSALPLPPASLHGRERGLHRPCTPDLYADGHEVQPAASRKGAGAGRPNASSAGKTAAGRCSLALDVRELELHCTECMQAAAMPLGRRRRAATLHNIAAGVDSRRIEEASWYGIGVPGHTACTRCAACGSCCIRMCIWLQRRSCASTTLQHRRCQASCLIAAMQACAGETRLVERLASNATHVPCSTAVQQNYFHKRASSSISSQHTSSN